MAAVGMTVSAGAVAAAVGVAECARGWADGRVAEVTFRAGTALSTAGVLTISGDGLAVAAGTAASTAGVLAVVEDGLTVAAGTPTSAAGVLAVADDGLAGAAGVFAAGVLAAAVAAQCSEITFSPVTTKLLSATPELAVSLVLCPMRLTSWPRCKLRSTLLMVILRI
jgi:hypothetical protein